MFRHLLQKEFWTSFSFKKDREYYYTDRSQRWSVGLTGFYRNIKFSYSRPWDPKEYR